MNRRIQLFGCTLDSLTMGEVVDRLLGWAGQSSECRYVVTPNVNHVVMLESHTRLRGAYADAALVLADGMPLVMAAKVLGRQLPERVAGSDLVPALLEAANSKGGLRIFLLGALPGVADRAAENIKSRWPSLEVVGTYSPPLGFENDAAENARIIAMIAEARPQVLVVGLGAPKQELWVHEHRKQLSGCIALCVGATIDFLAGKKSRAPRWMRKIGLEWVHRVATEPRRLCGRYWRDARALPSLFWREWKTAIGAAAARHGA